MVTKRLEEAKEKYPGSVLAKIHMVTKRVKCLLIGG